METRVGVAKMADEKGSHGRPRKRCRCDIIIRLDSQGGGRMVYYVNDSIT